MDIKDLPPEIQELAHQRQREQGNDGTFDGPLCRSKREGNFDWINTPEVNFWHDVFNGRKDIKNSPFYPHSNYQIY